MICEFLARNKGQVFTREQIYEAVFSLDGESDNSTIATHIKNIRAKLSQYCICLLYTSFQISVIQDIQSYGQLKTLGTTRRQIKKLISKQVMRLSCIGIPIGLLIGFFIGRSLVPFLMNGTAYTAAAGIKVSVNPLIFIGSAIFAWITVYISCLLYTSRCV